MVCSVWDVIETGPVKQLAAQWEIPVEDSRTSSSSFTNHLLSMIPRHDSSDAWSDEECCLYRDAAIALGRAFSYTDELGAKFSTWDALRIWPMLISLEYMRLLKKGHPGALILLAHYCVLLKNVESHWYFEWRTTMMMSAILRHLEPKWLVCIKWPLKMIRAATAEQQNEELDEIIRALGV